jgi:hypothetical protein
VAVSPQTFGAVPALTRDEAEALRLAEAYLTRAGTQVARRPLGNPAADRETANDAEFGTALLRAAALGAGLRDLADDRPLRV